MARLCKICKLKNTHPEVYDKFTKQIKKGKRGTAVPFLEKINKEHGFKFHAMNYQRPKKITLYDRKGNEVEADINEVIKELNPKQKLFCEEYIMTFNQNGYQAYSKVYASEDANNATSAASLLLSNNNVHLYVRYLDKKRLERLTLGPAYVMEHLKTIVERCMQIEEVRDNEGNATGEFKFDAKGAKGALELIGKYNAMWEKKPEESDSHQILKGILEKLISNQINPLTAGLELDKAGVLIPEALKIAMRKAELPEVATSLDSDDLDIKQMTDEELDRIITLGEEV